MNEFTSKLRELLFSIVPIVLIVIILNIIFPSILGWEGVMRFTIGAVFITFGLTLFLLGIDKAITPLGNEIGETSVRTNKLSFVILIALLIGFLVVFAEPGLHIYGNQVSLVTQGDISSIGLVIIVAIGMAILLALAFIRLVFRIPLYILLTILYTLILIVAIFTQPEFLVIAFDASGAATGVLSLPFIMALSTGISRLKKQSKDLEKDSFGTLALVSTGSVLAVLILGLFMRGSEYHADLDVSVGETTSILKPFIQMMPNILWQSFIIIVPLVIVFIIFNYFSFKFKKKTIRTFVLGFVYTFVGLFLFLTGVNAGFMDIGSLLGSGLAVLDSKLIVIIVGFILGLVTVLAEPSVYILTHQVEDVTSGSISRPSVLTALGIGVAVAIGLALLKIFIPGLLLWHFLLPGYIIAVSLMYFVPKIFVGIAFDSGGVATGPITTTFILAFTQGAASITPNADVILDGLGMIALVALAPMITLQILGLIFKIKSKKEGIVNYVEK